jgi:hypothetical protein
VLAEMSNDAAAEKAGSSGRHAADPRAEAKDDAAHPDAAAAVACAPLATCQRRLNHISSWTHSGHGSTIGTGGAGPELSRLSALDDSSGYPQIIHDWFINSGV